jgi:hypothetical protein
VRGKDNTDTYHSNLTPKELRIAANDANDVDGVIIRGNKTRGKMEIIMNDTELIMKDLPNDNMGLKPYQVYRYGDTLKIALP